MQRKAMRVQKVVSIMHDPEPQLVSLVKSPANQTPFKAIKSAETEALAQRSASKVVDIAKMVFTKSVYKTEEAVQSYLDANGYEDCEITENGNTWVIVGRSEEDFEGGLEEIAATKGLTIMTGRLRPARKSAAAPAADAPVQTKRSMYEVSAMASVLQSIGYIASELEWEAEYEGDGSPIPAKLRDWLSSGAVVFKEMATEEVDEMVAKITGMVESKKTELAQRAAPVTATLEDALHKPLDLKTTPVAAPGTAPTAVKPAATSTIVDTPAPNPEDKPAEAPPVQTTPETPPAVVEATAEGAPPAPEPSAEVTTKTEAPAFDMEALAALITKTVETAVQPVANQLTELKETATKSAERLTAVEAGQRQTRKSGDNEDTSANSTQAQKAGDNEDPETKKDREFTQRQQKNALGV